MQWIIENQSVLLSALGSAAISGAVVGWWVKQKLSIESQLLEQQLHSNQQLANSQIDQLKQSLVEAQQELDELDQDRDKAAYELKQSHGKLMAVMEKLRYFDAVKQERQQYAEDLNQVREHKSQLEAQLREQEARHQQAPEFRRVIESTQRAVRRL